MDSLNVTDEIKRLAETVALKYVADQRRYPALAGTPFVTTSNEFDEFMDAVKKANPEIPGETLSMHRLKSGNSAAADAIMEIITQAVKRLEANGHAMPAMPHLFRQDTPGRGNALG
ncbi:MAG: hypothetical protein KGJ06_06830 [Pseudomonadota bacterium]|nr:hypothetical protein [Pseudomonadota bacterium]